MTDSKGITRRELLRKGAALGGAVAWMTPVVQTVGMGRAFAQVPSPPPSTTTTTTPEGGKEISYIVINVNCGEEGEQFSVKWEDGSFENGAGWEAPDCGTPLGPIAGSADFGVVLDEDGKCATISVPNLYLECDLTIWVKAGSEQSTESPCIEWTSQGSSSVFVCSAAG